LATEIEILQHISETGDCRSIMDDDPCKICPLARITRRPDGSGWLSCLEAIAGSSLKDISIKYKRAAESKLIEMAIEGAIDDKKEVAD